MPQRAPRPCTKPGCPALATHGSRCEPHQQQWKQELNDRDAERATAAERGYDSRWKIARDGFLAKHPLCAECERVGLVKAATVVDHKRPHRGDKKLFWDRDNWQPLCKQHHDQKTARHDGGFGNARAHAEQNGG